MVTAVTMADADPVPVGDYHIPNTVAWFDDAGQHMETLDHERPVGEHLLLHFHRAVESLLLKSSSLEDAHRAILIANQAKLSCETGQRVFCDA